MLSSYYLSTYPSFNTMLCRILPHFNIYLLINSRYSAVLIDVLWFAGLTVVKLFKFKFSAHAPIMSNKNAAYLVIVFQLISFGVQKFYDLTARHYILKLLSMSMYLYSKKQPIRTLYQINTLFCLDNI